VVAKVTWGYIRELLGIDIGTDYLSVATKWLQKEKMYCANVILTDRRGDQRGVNVSQSKSS
jgi:hypothetical protein